MVYLEKNHDRNWKAVKKYGETIQEINRKAVKKYNKANPDTNRAIMWLIQHDNLCIDIKMKLTVKEEVVCTIVMLKVINLKVFKNTYMDKWGGDVQWKYLKIVLSLIHFMFFFII